MKFLIFVCVCVFGHLLVAFVFLVCFSVCSHNLITSSAKTLNGVVQRCDRSVVNFPCMD